MLRLFFSCLCFLFCAYPKAQSPFFTVTHFTTANGLADNSVNTILQDSRGFIWFGTREGLSRFDGTAFKNFFAQKNDSTAMPGNSVRSLFEYRPGRLLLISDGRLTTMNTVSRQFNQPPQFRDKSVQSINRVEKNRYSVNMIDSSFIITEEIKIVDTLVPPFKMKGVSAIVTRISNKKWLVGSPAEYFLYDTEDKGYTAFLPLSNTAGPQKRLTFQYYDEKQDWLYFSNYFNGLFRYSIDGRLLHHWKREGGPMGLSDGNISFVIPKNDSTLWIGGYEHGGLKILNTHTNLFNSIDATGINSSLESNSVYLNYTDHDGNEWIAMSGGVSKLTRPIAGIRVWEKEFAEIEENNTLLNLVKGRDGNMYLSVLGTHYCYKIDISNGGVSLLDERKLPYVWCMNRFGHEMIFTGGTTFTTLNTLTNEYRQDDFLRQYFPYSDIVILAFKHSNGDAWFSGNNGGGFVRVDANGSIHQYKTDGPRGTFQVSYYTCYVEDKNGDLWFGVNKSARLLHWNAKKDSFKEVSFDTVNGIARNNLAGISDLTLDGKNGIWMAFDGAGIARYDPSENRAVQYTLQQGLPTNFVYALQFDDRNRLWIGTLKGLSCLLVDENRFANFSKEDGLPADYFAERCIYYDSSRRELWVGSKKTLIRLYPDSLLSHARKALPIYIDEILVNGRVYTVDQSAPVHFAPTQNNLQIRFVALDINSGTDIEYSYQLAGADEDWIYNSTNLSASYANLAPGDYSFRVRARHKGDVEWMSIQQPLLFSIATPWYKTWWFGLLVLTAVVALFIQVLKTHFQKRLQKQTTIMEKELAIEQERTRLARELHDGLGSMLSGIKHSFSAIRKGLDLDEGKAGDYTRNIDKLNDSIREIRSISHSMASGTLLSTGLENSLSDYCRDLNTPGGIKVSFEALRMEGKQCMEEQAFHVFRIVQELLQNIFKHSGATHAIVQLSYNANRLYIAVEDDGKGFEIKDAVSGSGLGLKNIQSRIKILHGKMDVRSAPGNGTSILIEIPFVPIASIQ